jgi:ASC-1-like (ASCH) protein
MSTHEMKLADEPFQAIKAGRKIIESRLYDEKRQQIQLGDTLIFRNSQNIEESVNATVAGLLRYQTFTDLFADLPPHLFDRTSPEAALAQIRQFFSEADEQKFGVIGIRFVVK